MKSLVRVVPVAVRATGSSLSEGWRLWRVAVRAGFRMVVGGLNGLPAARTSCSVVASHAMGVRMWWVPRMLRLAIAARCITRLRWRGPCGQMAMTGVTARLSDCMGEAPPL